MLLYGFFGGSANEDKLLDKSKGKIAFGADRTAVGGEKAKEVTFYATQRFLLGNSWARFIRPATTACP
jgi:hypothetical protein